MPLDIVVDGFRFSLASAGVSRIVWGDDAYRRRSLPPERRLLPKAGLQQTRRQI
jgi:hypothetical protein